MERPSRDLILSEIRRCAAANGGAPLGRSRFQEETGIRPADWQGHYWARWGDAVRDAGLQPNGLQSQKLDDEDILCLLAGLTRDLGHYPTTMEMRLQRLSDPEFPNSKVVSKRFGSRVDQINRLRSYVDADPALGDVAPLLGPPAESASHGALPGASPRAAVLGQVYLLKLGRHYKIGRSNAFGRRERELSIQMPERATTVHVIQTDDPVGIERYWHVRFMERRVRPDAEWFALTNEDVAAFKRRRFQ